MVWIQNIIGTTIEVLYITNKWNGLFNSMTEPIVLDKKAKPQLCCLQNTHITYKCMLNIKLWKKRYHAKLKSLNLWNWVVGTRSESLGPRTCKLGSLTAALLLFCPPFKWLQSLRSLIWTNFCLTPYPPSTSSRKPPYLETVMLGSGHATIHWLGSLHLSPSNPLPHQP